jgi:hypothetical protein
MNIYKAQSVAFFVVFGLYMAVFAALGSQSMQK